MSEDDATLSHGVVERVRADGHYDVRLPEGVQLCHVNAILRRVGVAVGEGDRVTIRTEADGIFRGEITQVRPAVAAVAEPVVQRPGLIARRGSALLPKDQKIDRTTHPGWRTGADQEPEAGDEVYCTGGLGRVLRVLGKTGNGSRLLEIRMPLQPRTSFFAAASNVLIAPMDSEVTSPVAVLER